jgi:hypothetical protein
VARESRPDDNGDVVFLSRRQGPFTPLDAVFHLFLSYTRTPDAALAREVERLLEAFHRTQPPGRTEPLPPLSICVDGSDFTLPPIEERVRADRVRDVLDVVYDHLGRSRELLVLCSTGAAQSRWVEDEVRWFIDRHGAGRVRVAFTEGDRPWEEPARYFPKPLLDHALHKGVAYDLRGYDARRARAWHQVPEFGREMVRLAADLHGLSSGQLYPTWLEAELERARRQSATMASSARFETFAGDPSRAVLQAFAAHELHPDETTERAVRDAYRVAVLHHQNRRELSRITGEGPRYLAARWKQGDVFVKTSPDGRFRLLVTKRGKDGPNPPGDVYLVNNETLRAVKLEPPDGMGARVEDVAFDRSSSRVFVSRYFHLIVYGIDGQHRGGYEFSRHTKSPIHLLDGLFEHRYILGAETKGGVWLADPDDSKRALTIHGESYGDVTLFTDIAPGARRATLVYESGKADLLELDAGGQPVLREIAATGLRYAGFPTGRDDTLAVTGALGELRVLEIAFGEFREIVRSTPLGAEADWIAFDPQANRFAVIGADRRIHIVDGTSGAALATLDYASEIDWRETLAVPVTRRSWSRGKLWEPGEGSAFPSDTLAVSALQHEQGETWIATESWPNEYWPEYTVHRIDNGRAHVLSGGNLPLRWHGNLLDLGNSRPFLRTGFGLARFPADDGLAERFLQQDDCVWIGSWQGLYRLQGFEATLMTPPDVRVAAIVEADGRLWFGGLDGAYVLDGERLFRVTDPFENVKSIVSAGGRIWINGAAHANTAHFLNEALRGAPAIRPHGQLLHAVSESSGAAWFAAPGHLWRVLGADVRTIPIESRVTSIAQVGRTLWLTTFSGDGMFARPGPTYRMDVDTLEPIEDGTGGTGFVRAGELTLLVEETWGLSLVAMEPEHRSAILIDERGRRTIELGASLERVVPLGEVVWLLTTAGAFVLDGETAVRAKLPALAYTSALVVGNDTWLLATTAAVRLRDGAATRFDSGDSPARSVIDVAGDCWILTGEAGTPGPAFRVRGTRATRHAPDGAGVSGIVRYGDTSWFLTRREGRAGPMRRVGKTR